MKRLIAVSSVKSTRSRPWRHRLLRKITLRLCHPVIVDLNIVAGGRPSQTLCGSSVVASTKRKSQCSVTPCRQAATMSKSSGLIVAGARVALARGAGALEVDPADCQRGLVYGRTFLHSMKSDGPPRHEDFQVGRSLDIECARRAHLAWRRADFGECSSATHPRTAIFSFSSGARRSRVKDLVGGQGELLDEGVGGPPLGRGPSLGSFGAGDVGSADMWRAAIS